MSTPGPSPNASPSKPGAKSGLPDKVANASLEELQKITMDCLKKLKVLPVSCTECSSLLHRSNPVMMMSHVKSLHFHS